MFPNNGAMPSMGVPVKKRRNRKKKPVVLDPEAERQEQELRMKIKQSLHTQQVLRTEVEEDEAQRTSANVANDAMRGGIVGGHQAHAQAMGSQMNNIMMSGGMSMGFANMQPQMGEMGMQQQQQQQQYQFDNRNQQYGYHQNQEGSGIEKIIPNMQHQMQQIQQQLEIQRQQLEGQAKMKQQMEMEQQRKINQQMEMEELLKMKQQMILQQHQIQEHQHQHQIQQRQQFQPQPSLSPQPQSSFSPQPQRQQAQSQLDSLSGNQEFEAKLSSEDIMRRLKYEQERLLKEAQKRANADNIDNSAEKSSAISPSPPYVPAQYQQNSNFHGVHEVSGQSSQQQQLDSVPLCKFTNEQDQPQNSPQFPAQSKNSQQQNQQQQHQQFYPHQDGMAHGNFTNQQVKNQTQFPPYDVQIQAQQSEPFPIQKGAPHNQQHNGKNTHNMIHLEERTMSAQLSPQLQRRKSGQETLEKSLFSAGSNAESWLKATGSVNTSDLLNNSSFSSMAFHSMGNMSNMSASFSSLAGAVAVDAPGASPDSGEEMEGSPNLGGSSKGNEADSKESTVDGNTSGGTQAAAGQSDRGNDEEGDSTSINKGSPDTDTTIPTQLIALQPIQENETDENVGKNPFGQSSLMMSMMDGEFVQSALSMYGANSDSAMSVDSTTLNALMKQSQTGEISLFDYERRKLSSSSSENNQVPSPGNTTAKNGKQDVSNSNGSRSLSSGKSNVGDSANSSSVISSVSMEDNQPKELNTTNGDGSVHSSRSGRGGRAAAPRFDMMKEISQWTLNNPFDEDDDSDDDGALAAPPTPEGRVSNEGQGHGIVQRGNGFDIGDFHSLGGSIDTMNLSMMSSMTESNMPSSLRLDTMSDSLQALNVSDRETGQRKG